jgi:nucleotide-binding universal stress UspA family protein
MRDRFRDRVAPGDNAVVAADQMIADRPFSLVLAGVDGSERANEAARQAARLASAAGAQLIVAYVIEDRPYEEGDAERALEAASAAARAAGVDPEERILTGDAGDVLAEDAERDGVDLLCVGPDSGLLGGAIRFGHVAGKILRDATCSVLIARPAEPAFPRHIACAIPPELEPSVKALSSLGIEPIREMAMGRPERTLVRVAERDEVDLVVVGHRGIGGVTRALLGSVSEHVAHHAPCSVLVVRASGENRG